MKLKRKTIHILNGTTMSPKWIIEALMGGRWHPLMINGTAERYDSAEERDAALEKLKVKLKDVPA